MASPPPKLDSRAMSDALERSYLIAGDDGAKVARALSRLRARAVREGGDGALETFASAGGGAGPDVDALIGSIPAISLVAQHRYLLADGVERWRATQIKRMAAALEDSPEDVTVVLVARGKAPKGLPEAVRSCGGAVLNYEAPAKRELPGWLVTTARERGFDLAPHAARAMIARVGEGTVRLTTELERIALWAEPGQRVEVDDIELLTADDSERAGWTLGDAIVARDAELAVLASDELADQGEAVTPMIYGMASRLRNAHLAAEALERGRPAKEVEAALPMAPYPSKLLVRAVRGVEADELAAALGTIADLEWWTRGGSDYSDPVALTLAVRQAAGSGTAEE